MRNIKRKRSIVTLVLIAACMAVVAFLFMKGSGGQPSDSTSAADLQAAFPDDKPVQAPLSGTYRSIAENDNLILKLRENTLGIQIVEKRSGYVWSSEIGSTDSDVNEAWRNFMTSGLSIDYFEKNKSNSTRTDLLGQTDKSIQVKPIDQGFEATVRFHDLKIGMNLIVRLDGNRLAVEVPQKSILEGERYKLGSVFVYPFLGAAKGGEIGGYMFIPDGSGALIKLADNQGRFKTPYEAKIYGNNKGIDPYAGDMFTTSPYSARFPVFGIVHGEKRHAMLGIVGKGQYNAKIVSYPNGVNTQYNWTTVQFLIREAYLQPTSRSLGGMVVFEKRRNPEDMEVRYVFLDGQDASYVGMAKTYRNDLIANGELQKKANADENRDIPVHLDVLGAETENGMFSNRVVPMTTVKQLESIADELKAEGISRMNVAYRGWNRGGLSGVNPAPVSFEPSLGSSGDFEKLQRQLNEQGGKLYYYTDFTTAYEQSERFSAISDAAKKIDKTVLALPTYQEVYDTVYYMSARHTRKIIQENLDKYEKQGVNALAIDATPYELFSEWDGETAKSRMETAQTYRKAMESLAAGIPSMSLYHPNDYMLRYADSVLDIPMDSSRYIFISETVPFEQIVLKGFKDYYAEPANFFANPQESLLKMIETGSYPSYYLTQESSYRLKHSNSSHIYTSAFADWKDDIVKTFNTVNEALKQVQNATMENREILAEGVVKVTYSNGKAIVVNYNDRTYVGGDFAVPASGFKVIEVKR